LSAEARAVISVEIRRRAMCYGIGWADPAEIDSLNILHATFLAMRRAVLAMSVCPERLIVDGNRLPRLEGLGTALTARAIIGGDATEPSISAASILAKTARDEYMDQMDTIYPQYAFASHKGYATRQHRLRLSEHGPCVLHRRSFAPVFALVSGRPLGEPGADEWDDDLEWIPDVDQDPELESYLER
jgi:ribonuclease HII